MAVVLAKDQVAMELFLAIHEDDKDMIKRKGTVPRRIYAASNKGYLSLREDVAEAVVRVQELFDGRCELNKEVLLVLKIQFSLRGFYTYGTACRTQAPYAPLLHKIQYSNHDEKDWKAWAFHGDLPLKQTSDTGEVLIASEWMLID
jgi:hypothetical protein